MTLTFVPRLKIAPHKLTCYTEVIGQHRRPRPTLSDEEKEEMKKQKQIKKAEGIISVKAKSNINHRFAWLIHKSPERWLYCKVLKKNIRYRLGFVTLTLSSPQMHSDQEIKKVCLDDFLDNMRKRFKIKHYIWRAESQKNGNIHFHIVINKYIHYAQIRDYWNKSQEKLGYVSKFKEVYGHENPNSTDIHAIKHIHKLAAYFTKYFSKNEPNRRKVEGKLWDCSEVLNSLGAADIVIDSNIANELNFIISSFAPKFRQCNYATVYFIGIANIGNSVANFSILNAFNTYCDFAPS